MHPFTTLSGDEVFKLNTLLLQEGKNEKYWGSYETISIQEWLQSRRLTEITIFELVIFGAGIQARKNGKSELRLHPGRNLQWKTAVQG
jgi:hypothetical protein